MCSGFSFINDASSGPKIKIFKQIRQAGYNHSRWMFWSEMTLPDVPKMTQIAYEIGVDLFRVGETKNKKLGITDNENELAKNGHSDRGARLLSKSLNLDSRKR